MPLMHGKSAKAFSHNVGAEMDAGKPQKQSLAIAYAVKRRAKKAHGGAMCAEGCAMDHEHMYEDGGAVAAGPHISASAGKVESDAFKNSGKAQLQKIMDYVTGSPMSGSGTAKAAPLPSPTPKMARGGMADAEDEYDPMQHPEPIYDEAAEHEDDDMISRIMRQRFSMGGKVANNVGTGQEADAEENQFDDLVKDDDLEFHYTGANSGDDLGDQQEDEDRHDIVSKIMKSRAKKDRLPRPA